MRCTVVALLFGLAVPSFAQEIAADSRLIVQMRDGASTSVETPARGRVGVIVEFREAPLALRGGRASKAALTSYRDTFARFRADAAAILGAGVAPRHAVEPAIRHEYYEAFHGVALSVPSRAVAQLRALPYVKAVHRDARVHALAGAEPDPDIVKINAPRVWALGTRGAGVVVAIIDTGIDYTHPALGGGFGPGARVIGGYDFVNDDGDPMDDHFHGTHVAGTVAGNSPELLGVAPEASLLAYKVLDATGSGNESDVVAAIERVVDPNGDGDLSDHADVANLSLGGEGGPDDAASTAVDNATAAGVVFAVAAGNSGAFHAIGSPGTARKAITVGASDNSDAIARFSSRGPNTRELGIKPDVVAPGAAIRSSMPRGRYDILSGTSMATPHVAGAAALLKALHRDWPPARIKGALMLYAALLADDVMAKGGGRIDALAASDATLRVDPPSLGFGLRPDGADWKDTRTLHVTNDGSAAVTLAFAPTSVVGVTATVSPSPLSLAPGQSGDVVLTLDVKPSLLKVPASFTVGGDVIFGAGRGQVHVPWAFTKASRATIAYDGDFAAPLLMGGDAVILPTRFSEKGSEAIVKGGTYDLIVFGLTLDEAREVATDPRLIHLPAQSVDGDVTLNVAAAQAKHLVTLAGRDEQGRPLGGNGYASDIRLVLTGATSLAMQLPWLPSKTLRLSDLPAAEKVLIQEVQFAPDRVIAVQHPPIETPEGDLTLTTGGADLKGADVRLMVPAAPSRDVFVAAFPGASGQPQGPIFMRLRPDAAEAAVRMAMTPDVDPSYGMSMIAVAVSFGHAIYETPALTVVDGALKPASTLPWAYSGDGLAFGFGPMWITPRFLFAAGTPGHPAATLTFSASASGELGEFLEDETSAARSHLFDAAGSEILPSKAGSDALLFADVTPKREYRLDAVFKGSMYPAVPRQATLSMTFDTNRADATPPAITSLMLYDEGGRIATRLQPLGSGTLTFSVADYAGGMAAPGAYQAVRGEATHAAWRVHGTAAWRPLDVVQVQEDAGSSSVAGAGMLFRAAVGSSENGLIDLKIDTSDVAGNTTTLTIAPAFSVGPEIPPRHRAAGQ